MSIKFYFDLDKKTCVYQMHVHTQFLGVFQVCMLDGAIKYDAINQLWEIYMQLSFLWQQQIIGLYIFFWRQETKLLPELLMKVFMKKLLVQANSQCLH